MRCAIRRLTILSTLVAAACGGSDGTAPSPEVSASSGALQAQGGHGAAPAEPPMLGIHWARGVPGPSSPNMTWHGGIVLTSALVHPIYWGTSWSSATFVGDKITGLASFYGGLAGSTYANTCTEYAGSNGQVTSQVAYDTFDTDLGAAPTHAPQTSTILNEVCARIANPVANGYYPVYVDTRRGHISYCAWHSYGTCNGVPIQFAFFFNLDGDAGCDPQDTSGLHSQGLAALANVSGHEISETMTDPRNGGWYDASGYENADKCAWTFGQPLLALANGTQWKIQGNWSNAAYTAGTGYPNGSGQNGCEPTGP